MYPFGGYGSFIVGSCIFVRGFNGTTFQYPPVVLRCSVVLATITACSVVRFTFSSARSFGRRGNSLCWVALRIGDARAFLLGQASQTYAKPPDTERRVSQKTGRSTDTCAIFSLVASTS